MGIDTSFAFVAYMVPEIMHFQNGVIGHFEYCAAVEIAVTFKKGIGAHFLLNSFR